MPPYEYRVEYHGTDADYLLNYKTLHFGGYRVNTPFAAQEIGRWTGQDKPLDEARGFNEVYCSISPEHLSNGDRDLQSEIEQSVQPAKDSEPTVLFFEIRSEEIVDSDLLETIVDLQLEYSDFLATPFRSGIVDAINSGTREINPEEYFDRYEATRTDYLDIVAERTTPKTVLGGIPMLRWGRTREIIQDYLKREIAALCVNFNGRSPLVPSQIDNIIAPLQAELGTRGWHEDGFLYAINAHRGQRTNAGDFLALAVGFDGLGGYHTRVRGDEEFLEKLQEREKTTFRMFHKSEFIHRIHPISEIVQQFPTRTNLEAERVQRLAENGSADEVRKILEAEQKALGANDLRQAINFGNAADLLQSKASVDGWVQNALDAVLSAHDSDSRQDGLPGAG